MNRSKLIDTVHALIETKSLRHATLDNTLPVRLTLPFNTA